MKKSHQQQPANEEGHVDAVLEMVPFDDTTTLVVTCTPECHSNITTTLPLHLPAETCTPIRETVANYTTTVCRVASPPVAAAPSQRRRARSPAKAVTIRRSERLAKKSRSRATMPALQAQNVLMRRFVDATSFQHFVDTFSSTLSESQCEALDVLLPNMAPSVAAVESETLLA